jgi:16S rRNA (cytidine1402-2'-O)-methyltransferase
MAPADLDAALRDALAVQSLRDAADAVAVAFGLARKDVYQRALALRGEGA